MKLLYAGLFFLFGFAGLWAGLRVSSEVRKGKSWPTVPGKVLSRRLEVAPQLRNPQYEPRAEYRYEVDGKPYTSEQVYLVKGTSGSARRMQKVLDGLPDEVKVHYDPADPARAYLLVNAPSTSWIMVGAGSFAILLGLAQLLMFWHKRQG